MKLVTNKVPVITNGMYPSVDMQKGTTDWSKVIMAEAGTVFKVKAIMMNQVYLENSKYSLWLIQEYNSGLYLSAILNGGATLRWCRQPYRAIYYYSKIDASEDIESLGINAIPVEKPR